jgi:hypothetical protein
MESETDTAPTVLPFATFADLRQRVSETSWLWPGHIPRGHTTIIAGDPGIGKSLLVLDLVRRCLEGGEWPDGSPCQRLERVMIVDTEGTQAVALSRVHNLGIPLERVLLPFLDPLQELLLDNTDSWNAFLDAVTKARPGLILVDSLCGVSGGDEDSSRDMTKVLVKLQKLARDARSSVIATHHLRKRSEQQSLLPLSLDRIRGSTAITANARAVFGIEFADPNAPDGARKLTMLKSNLSPHCDPLGFVLDEERIEWVDLPEMTEIKSEGERAIDFLRRELADGPVLAREMRTRAENAGLSWRAVQRAKPGLVETGKQRGAQDSPWVWSLSRAQQVAA